jgi:two-component system, sensor histidine kinase RegB
LNGLDAAGLKGMLGRMSVPTVSATEAPPRRARLRLRTLVRLRWLAVAGQTVAVLVVSQGLGFETPLAACLALIAASAWVNVVLTFGTKVDRPAHDWEAAAQIAFDIVQLGALLAITGGLANPFTVFLIAPATIGAAALPARHALMLALLAVGAASVLSIWSLPLPWTPGEPIVLPEIYRIGIFIATALGICFTAGYASRASAEAARMEQALHAAEQVLAREQQLSALGGLAAAAAHELGTPLATIQITAKEMLRELDPLDPLMEDAELLVSQASRCREILKTLGQKPDTSDEMHERMSLPQLLSEVADKYRGAGPEIETATWNEDGSEPPILRRAPEVIHALASFVDNAVDFASAKVEVTARYDARTATIEVRDDGKGFPAEVLSKIGQPYISTRPSGEGSRTDHHGMGLGVFIAKTLLERSGATVSFRNDKRGGAVVAAAWPRRALQDPSLAAGL